ncbi:MAG: type VI secretion system tube protein Hcp [Alphaproteobacteria bacterium]|nr:type VI secretion system tube protein Hcp [Alphaproteobacteria bacterium]
MRNFSAHPIKRLVTCLGAAALLSAPSWASVGYMKIGDIAGSASDIRHRSWVEIESFQWGTPRGGAMMGSMRGPTNVSVHELIVTKKVDQSSAKLREAATTGRHFQEVTIEIVNAGRNAERITLTEVMITGVQAGGNPERPTERISISFAKSSIENAEHIDRAATPMNIAVPPR